MGENKPASNIIAESAISLEDKYTATDGKVFMNGTQALVRLPIVPKPKNISTKKALFFSQAQTKT